MSEPDPLDILGRAPNLSELSQNSVIEGYAGKETRMCDFQPPGRKRVRKRNELVMDFLHKRCRLLLIYGEMYLGKAHFAQQIVRDLWYHCFDSRLPIHCRGMTSFESLLTSLASSLGIPPPYTDSNVIAGLRYLTSGSSNCSLILTFTNLEDIVSNNIMLRRFSTFLDDMFTACPNVAVIVTSRVNVNLLHGDFSVTYKLDPPSEVECCLLLKPILQFCKTYEPIFLIVRRCFYRPAFILHVCHIILSNRTIVTPEDIAEILRPEEGLLKLFERYPSPEGSLTEAIRRQLSVLPADLESDIRVLCHLDGTFGIVEATKTLERKSMTEFTVMSLLPLKDHALLDIDLCTQQIRIDPLIRQFILHHVRDNDPYKKLMVDFLGYMLRKVRLDISVRTKGRALGFAQDNYQCLEKTLTKAVHTCGEESYGVNMELVHIEEGSMSAVCPEKAALFYKAMVEASAKFGTNRDHALLQGLYAVMLIEERGDELDSAIKMVTNSLADIPDDDYYLRVVLMRRLGWIHIRLGNNEEAKRLLTKAKKLSFRVPEALEARVEPHRIQINSHLAIADVFLGKFDEALSLLQSTITRAMKVMPDHPVLAVMLQTMGLKYEREGMMDKAITFYKVSGNARRKFVDTLPSYLVTNQTNLASRYIWRGETEKALPLLESALKIRLDLCQWDYNTALILWYQGNAYLFSCRPEDAELSFTEAMKVLLRCTPRHTSIVNVRVALAHAYMVQGRLQEAERQFHQTLDHTAQFQRNINDDSLLTALEHLILMKRGTVEVGDIHKSLIQEAERLSYVSKDGDRAKHVLMERKLTEWRMYLGMVFGVDEARGQWGRNEKIVNLDWNVLFTCEHCKMLKTNHETWLSTSF